jgi:Histidine kinase-, DNA gyrase B-, and HSP90-like ATPase
MARPRKPINAAEGWKKHSLYQELLARRNEFSDSTVRTIDACLEKAVPILKHGGTSPSDFSLHDVGHSERVAERMQGIMPRSVIQGLFEFELGLLILAAYLHDIGMTPSKGKVRSHYAYFLCGTDKLSSDEQVEIREWILDQHPEVIIPLAAGREVTEKDIATAEFLCAHYCRWKHNDWSEEWIRGNLGGLSWKGYENWLDDLITLCRSHHDGYDELASRRFDPRLVASGEAGVVHLRYLACVLRTADILEFDPERTPEIVFKHRQVGKGSVVYWHKDHEVRIAFNPTTRQLFLTATPRSAVLHKAVLTMADEIDGELLLCKRLADETHFEKFPGPLPDLPHKWILPHVVHRQVSPKPSTYEFIDGSFRPDTKRLLEILSGLELYGSPWAAIRELIQNAFDATKEQIGREWLARPEPRESLIKIIEQMYSIDLKLIHQSGSLCLVCADRGVGMSKRIIENYLLVGGRSGRRERVELERKCEKAGYRLALTGQYGIGVLSYFMVADHIEIKTRRSMYCDDVDMTGWIFETDGIGTFGELRGDSALSFGTVVRLNLLPGFVGDEHHFARELIRFIEKFVDYIPCKLTVSIPFAKLEKEWNAGWTHSAHTLKAALSERLSLTAKKDPGPDDVLTLKARQEHTQQLARLTEIKKQFMAKINWALEEGDLPDNLGRFRIHIPYFDLPGGISFVFMLDAHLAGDTVRINEINRGNYMLPDSYRSVSWKGINVERQFSSTTLEAGASCVEINWEDSEAGRISVSRFAVRLSQKGASALNWLNHKVLKLQERIKHTNAESVYGLINAKNGKDGLVPKNMSWIENKDNVWQIRPLEFPLTTRTSYVYERHPPKLQWRGRPVTMTGCLLKPEPFDEYTGIVFNKHSGPCFVIPAPFYSNYKSKLIPLWTEYGLSRTRKPWGYESSMPPMWNNLILVRFSHFYGYNQGDDVWNGTSTLTKSLTKEAWATISKLTNQSLNPMPHKNALLSDKALASAWFAAFLLRGDQETWNALCEQHSEFVLAVWHTVSSQSDKLPLLLWREENPNSYCLRVTAKEASRSADFGEFLGDPGPEWSVTTNVAK